MNAYPKAVAPALGQKILRAPLRTTPFGHIYREQFFPPSLYRHMLRQLPDSDHYEKLKDPDALQPDGRGARFAFNLLPENIRRLPPVQRAFWEMLTQEMSSPQVEIALRTKFKKILEEHCQRRLSQIKLRARPMLVRDVAGSKMSMHSGIPQMAITTQFHLPADEEQNLPGTVLHERLPGGKFDEVCTLAFAPNSGYAFAVTTESWHSMKLMNTGASRNSLVVTYYYDHGWIVEGWKTVMRRLRASNKVKLLESPA